MIRYFLFLLLLPVSALAEPEYGDIDYPYTDTNYDVPSGYSAQSACSQSHYAGPNPGGISGCRVFPDGSRYHFICRYPTSGNTISYIGTACPGSSQQLAIYVFTDVASCEFGDPVPFGTNQAVCPSESACQFGSLSPDCAVQCEASTYSYYHNGIKKYGTLAEGQVGYGQSCPTPNYPSGTDSAQICSSSDNSPCLDDAYHESENVQEQNTTTNTTDNGDGTSTTTTTTTQGGASGTQNSAPTSSSTGTTGLNDRGQTIESDSSSGLNRGISDDQVVIGGEEYQLCNHGGIVSGSNLCDYTPPSCGSNQVPTDGFGCYDLPVIEPPPPNPPGQTTTTNTDSNGNTTTTTTTTSGTSTGGGTPTVSEEPSASATPSGSCSVIPSCDGDPVGCALLIQQHKEACGEFDLITGINDCSSDPVCEGDPIICSLIQQKHSAACELRDQDTALAAVDTGASSLGLADLDTVEAQMIADGYERDKEVDLSDELSAFTEVATTSGICPDDITISLGGSLAPIVLDMSNHCSLFQWIGAIVRFAASLVGFMMIFNTIREL